MEDAAEPFELYEKDVNPVMAEHSKPETTDAYKTLRKQTQHDLFKAIQEGDRERVKQMLGTDLDGPCASCL